MATNRDWNSFGSRRKNSEICSDDWHRWHFWSAFRHFRTHFTESFHMYESSWMMDPTWDVQLLSYWFNPNPVVFQNELVNLIKNLRGGHCFGSSRTRRNRGGNITMFKLGHPVFDGDLRWCMFLQCFCQNGENFLRRIALQKKKLDSSHLHVVKIARVAWYASFQPL